jgi:hypothetical protein
MNPPIPGDSTATRPAEKICSPFWPVWVVFLTLIFLQSTYLLNDFKQQSQIKAARTQLKSALAQAQAVNQTTEAVGRELVALSGKSTEAARIVAEFKIKVNPPAEPASKK